MTARSEVLLIGGRSGVGKSIVGNEMHAQLSAAGVQHCLIEGDNLDLAYPAPWKHGLDRYGNQVLPWSRPHAVPGASAACGAAARLAAHWPAYSASQPKESSGRPANGRYSSPMAPW